MANEAETGFAKVLWDEQERLYRLLGLPAELQPYLTGNWFVPPPMLTGGFPLTAAADPSRYPHVCPRCSGQAYVGAVEVDCAGGCK